MVRSLSLLPPFPSQLVVTWGVAVAACTATARSASAQESPAPTSSASTSHVVPTPLPATAPGLAPPLPGAASAATPAPNAPASMPEPPRSSKLLTLASAERWALGRSTEVLIARAQTGIAGAQVEEFRAPLLPQVIATGQIAYGNGRVVSTAAGTSVAGTASSSSNGTGAGTGANTGSNTGGANTGSNTGGANTGSTSTGTVTTGGGNSAAWYWSAGASASQLIYDFGQATNRYGAAKKTLESQRAIENTTKLQVILNVRRAYFTARADYELVLVARQTLQDQNTHLAQVQGFVTVGTQPQIALAQQRAAVANAQVQLITAQNNYELAKAQLNQAMGVQDDTDYDLGEEQLGPIDDEEKSLDTLIQRAMAARPELASLARQAEADEKNLSAVKGAFGPTLSASGNIEEVSAGSFDSGLFIWSVGLLATWPIFQGGLTLGQVHQAESTLAMARAQITQEALQVRLDVSTAQLAVTAAKATIGSAQEAAMNAHEQRRLAEQRFATGVGSIIELFDAQVADTAAATQLVQARYQLSSARAQLLWALGRT
jgi:outer membrane protein